jgi:hypothetical protein
MDPLILAGEKVVPAVIDAVRHKEMPRRRYAILFLGNGGYVQALPVLRDIAGDEHEGEHFRGDALAAIYDIDRTEGTAVARKHSERPDYLGRTARDILSGRYRAVHRSYLAALLEVNE